MQQASPKNKKFRLVMIGSTGAGKSASANSILGKPAFLSIMSMSSVTNKSEKATSNRFGYELEIIDTPGFRHTDLSEDEVSEEIKRCVKMCLPGPHAFILVLRFGQRFTNNERNITEFFKKNFGEGMLQYLFVLFTGMDYLERHGKKLKQYINTAPNDLQDFLREIEDRYFGINNMEEDPKKKTEQVEDILKAVDLNVSKHGVAYYTSVILQEAEEEERRQKEKEKRKEQELMEQKEREKQDMSVMDIIRTGVEAFNVGKDLYNAKATVQGRIPAQLHS